jgi:predicted outer membrane repeat protein
MRRMFTRSFLVGLALLASSPALAATLDVDASGGSTYSTLQAAIDAASDGDNIRVFNGTYNESIDFKGKKIYVYARTSSRNVILDAGGAATWAVTATSGEPSGATLHGFTIRNAGAGAIYVANGNLDLKDVKVEGVGSTGYYGSGLYASNATVSAEDSSFSDVTSYVGGAVYATGSTLAFADTTFTGNYAYYGGAIYATTTDITATTVTLTGNESLYGGNLYLYDRSSLTATDLTATGNASNYGSGAAIQAAYSSDVDLTGGSISDNLSNYASSGYYGAVYVEQASSITATGVTFSNNEGYGGGAVTVYASSTGVFDTCTFTDHTSSYYGPIFAYSNVDVTVKDSTFSGNSVTGYGGGIYAASTVALDVEGSTFDGNNAVYQGGAVYAHYDVTATFTDTTFSSNESTNGGAIFAQQLYDVMTLDTTTFSANVATTGAGGAIYAYYYAELDLRDSTLEDNGAAGVGGAIAAYSLYGVATIDNTVFSTNSSTSSNGGAISAQGSTELDVTASTFTGNTAAAAGAVYGYYLLGEMAFDGCTFTANEASSSAGALYAYYYTETTVSNCTFDQNVAYTDGGAIVSYYEATPLNITNSTFTQNSAEHGSGGGVWAYYSVEANLSGNTFADNYACTSGGGALFSYLVDLTSTGDTFTGNTASKGYGGGLYQDGVYAEYGNAWLSDLTLTDNLAGISGGGAYLAYQEELEIDGLSATGNTATRDFGGGLYIGGSTDYSVSHAHICGNTADEGGGVYASNTTGGSTWTNNVVQENNATYSAGVRLVNEPGLSMVNNTLVGNNASKDGGNLYFYAVAGEVVNNIVAWSADGDGLVVDDSNTAIDTTFTYNDFWDNLGDDASGYLTDADLAGFAGNLFVDPELYDYTLDGNCDNDILIPAGGSPVINAGDPAILDGDGSVSDIGAYGGPDNDIEDQDGDGYASVIDCDDANATIHPGATEIVDDGIDQDCDGLDLTAADLDRDGDGHNTTAAGGDDCDDNDATVHPGAAEVWYDGIDQDCDGNDDDQDGDGFAVDRDCDDTDATVNPDAPEVPYNGVDDDCDPTTSDTDADGDGHDAVVVGGDDCDDTDAEVNPAATEVWYDGVDQDCSGGSDHDQDGDGHDATASGGDDCNDLDATKVTAADCGTGGDDTGTDTAIDGGENSDDDDDLVSAGDCGCANTTTAAGALLPGLLALGALAGRRRRA